jgi:predicted TPR repeat methyltransferase
MPFDRDYFERFYAGEARVYGPEQIDQLCRGLSGFIEFVGAPFSTVLDAGAGTGMVRDWFRARGKQVRSVDVSEFACQTYGHEQRDLASWCEPVTFDLIVCYGVLAYLDDEPCKKAIDNLAAMSSGFLYVNVTTNEDLFFGTVDEAHSDLDGMQLRPKAFYLERLSQHWVAAGLGLFYRRTAPLRLRSLERCG